jgi:peptidoglycan hydrolase CwlO-like protein
MQSKYIVGVVILIFIGTGSILYITHNNKADDFSQHSSNSIYQTELENLQAEINSLKRRVKTLENKIVSNQSSSGLSKYYALPTLPTEDANTPYIPDSWIKRKFNNYH